MAWPRLHTQYMAELGFELQHPGFRIHPRIYFAICFLAVCHSGFYCFSSHSLMGIFWATIWSPISMKWLAMDLELNFCDHPSEPQLLPLPTDSWSFLKDIYNWICWKKTYEYDMIISPKLLNSDDYKTKHVSALKYHILIHFICWYSGKSSPLSIFIYPLSMPRA